MRRAAGGAATQWDFGLSIGGGVKCKYQKKRHN
jgi:hypothetical protein